MTRKSLHLLSVLYFLFILWGLIYFPEMHSPKIQEEFLEDIQYNMDAYYQSLFEKLDPFEIVVSIIDKPTAQYNREYYIIKQNKIAKLKKEIEDWSRFGTDIPAVKSRTKKLNLLYADTLQLTYKYTNIHHLIYAGISYISEPQVCFLRNISHSDFNNLSEDEKKEFLLAKVTFEVLPDDYALDKSSIFINPRDSLHKAYTQALLLNGERATDNTDWENGSILFMWWLDPKDKYTCVMHNVDLDIYHHMENDFTRKIERWFIFFFVIFPYLYLRFEHKILRSQAIQNKRYVTGRKITPSLWMTMKTMTLSLYLLLFFPAVTAIAISPVASDDMIDAAIIFVILFVVLLLFPIILLAKHVKQVRRLFKHGVEVTAVFEGSSKHNFSGRPGRSVTYYNFVFRHNGKDYKISDIPTAYIKELINTKQKITALLDPRKPEDAIIKENYIYRLYDDNTNRNINQQ